MKSLLLALLLFRPFTARPQTEPQPAIHSIAVFQYCGRSIAIQILQVGVNRVWLHLFLRDKMSVTDYSELATLVQSWSAGGGLVTTTELNPECTRA